MVDSEGPQQVEEMGQWEHHKIQQREMQSSAFGKE